MIELCKAGVRYGSRWIFRQLDLSLEPGTTMALLGPNGRGKTTLIRAAVGLSPLEEGQRRVSGLIGYVPQSGTPAPYTVIDMVVMGRLRHIGLFGSPAQEDYRIAHSALDRVGVGRLAGSRYATLSGGERQLVLLARALATGAATLVLDEPAAALDFANQDRLLRILDQLRQERQHTILFSTHSPQDALLAADNVCLLFSENEQLCGPADSVLTEDNLARLYGIPVRRIGPKAQPLPMEMLVPLFGMTSLQPE